MCSSDLRIVHNVQELNKVTICDAALPPRVDDFAEGLVGRVIYVLASVAMAQPNFFQKMDRVFQIKLPLF